MPASGVDAEAAFAGIAHAQRMIEHLRAQADFWQAALLATQDGRSLQKEKPA